MASTLGASRAKLIDELTLDAISAIQVIDGNLGNDAYRRNKRFFYSYKKELDIEHLFDAEIKDGHFRNNKLTVWAMGTQWVIFRKPHDSKVTAKYVAQSPASLPDCEWMFGDVGHHWFVSWNLFRGSLWRPSRIPQAIIDKTSSLNPFRWSQSMSIPDAIEELRAVQQEGDRRVKLKVPSGPLMPEREFESIDEAIRYLEDISAPIQEPEKLYRKRTRAEKAQGLDTSPQPEKNGTYIVAMRGTVKGHEWRLNASTSVIKTARGNFHAGLVRALEKRLDGPEWEGGCGWCPACADGITAFIRRTCGNLRGLPPARQTLGEKIKTLLKFAKHPENNIKIVVAGHSQGAGAAAIFAQSLMPLKRTTAEQASDTVVHKPHVDILTKPNFWDIDKGTLDRIRVMCFATPPVLFEPNTTARVESPFEAYADDWIKSGEVLYLVNGKDAIASIGQHNLQFGWLKHYKHIPGVPCSVLWRINMVEVRSENAQSECRIAHIGQLSDRVVWIEDSEHAHNVPCSVLLKEEVKEIRLPTQNKLGHFLQRCNTQIRNSEHPTPYYRSIVKQYLEQSAGGV